MKKIFIYSILVFYRISVVTDFYGMLFPDLYINSADQMLKNLTHVFPSVLRKSFDISILQTRIQIYSTEISILQTRIQICCIVRKPLSSHLFLSAFYFTRKNLRNVEQAGPVVLNLFESSSAYRRLDNLDSYITHLHVNFPDIVDTVSTVC